MKKNYPTRGLKDIGNDENIILVELKNFQYTHLFHQH